MQLYALPIIHNTQRQDYQAGLSARPTLSSSLQLSHVCRSRAFGHCPKHVPATCPEQPSAQHLTATFQVAATWSSRRAVMPGRRTHKPDATEPLSSAFNLPCFSLPLRLALPVLVSLASFHVVLFTPLLSLFHLQFALHLDPCPGFPWTVYSSIPSPS